MYAVFVFDFLKKNERRIKFLICASVPNNVFSYPKTRSTTGFRQNLVAEYHGRMGVIPHDPLAIVFTPHVNQVSTESLNH